jgi:hypothetical protein
LPEPPAALYLTWNDSRRSRSVARLIGLPRRFVPTVLGGAGRHAEAAVRTVGILVRLRPCLLWFQFSWALGLLLWLYAGLRGGGVRLVADVHSKALRRSGLAPISRLLVAVKRRALRRCVAVLVSNDHDRAYAGERFGVTALVLPDPLPEPPPPASAAVATAGEAVFVCSFAVDEPFHLIASVAERLRGRVRGVVTGDPAAATPTQRAALHHAGLATGFLPEDRYWDALRGARAVVVLSTEPACLPCGAYEAMAAGQRPIVADDPVARATFGESARYAQLTVEAVERTVLEAVHAGGTGEAAHAYGARWRVTWGAVRPALAQAGALP